MFVLNYCLYQINHYLTDGYGKKYKGKGRKEYFTEPLLFCKGRLEFMENRRIVINGRYDGGLYKCHHKFIIIKEKDGFVKSQCHFCKEIRKEPVCI